MRTCKNPYCNSEATHGARCGTCNSYLSRMGAERPRELCQYPNRGHNLAAASEVLEMTGVTYRQLDWLHRSSGYECAINVEGSGYRRGYTLEDVMRVYLLIAVPAPIPQDLDLTGSSVSVDVGEFTSLHIDLAALRERLQSQWPEGRDMELEKQ